MRSKCHTNMRVRQFSFALLLLIFFSNLTSDSFLSSVSAQCAKNQKDLLLELRNHLIYDDSSVSSKLVQWNESSDCCQWSGVSCNSMGRVTGLHLSNQSISGGIDCLSRLESLQSLNLALNNFNSVLPSGFGLLINLSYLNLSNSGFQGQVPAEYSKLTRLHVLDLSYDFLSERTLRISDLRTLIQNFSRLRELHLDGVNISANGYGWCNGVSSFLPDLRVLSFSRAYLTGPFDSSLTKLQSLEIIRLHGNTFSLPFPKFFADFPNLRVLTMYSCNLSGVVPEKLFQIATLQIIDLSFNNHLKGSLPEFPLNASLENILLSDTNFSGNVPQTIGRLRILSRFSLNSCNFFGSLPKSFTNLTQLVYLDLSSNNFTGPVPSFNSLKNLWRIDLSANGLSSQIPDSLWEGLEKLDYLILSYNLLEGEIPASIFLLPSLKNLHLSNNRFSGFTGDFGSSSAFSLLDISLSMNNLKGPIPQFIFNMHNLSVLSLSWNKLNGSLDLIEFRKLAGLLSLDLSHNNLSVHISENVAVTSLFPRLVRLELASCKLQRVPDFKNHPSLMWLDLSDNNIDGEIPNWIWEVNDGFLNTVNLSHNQFTSLQEPYKNLRSLYVLDLHSNLLGGKVPLLLLSVYVIFVDFSSNKFSSPLPADIGNSITYATFFSVANNKISGTIPTSLCNASYIQVLDLSNNSFHGRIPSCLVGETLGVLNLQRNNLSGNIPYMFPHSCGLKTLDLSWNRLQGRIPISLSRCREIQVLNLGTNNLTGAFPCFENLSRLHVLVLRSNTFYGNISCLGENYNTMPNLHIVDLASNNFNGDLPAKLFWNIGAMMADGDGTQPQLNMLRFVWLTLNQFYYQYSVAVTLKGQNIVLEKILTVFISIDLSNNRFQGVIPETFGKLHSLYSLNVSHNAISRQIPASFGNLRKLESLDLSSNNLSGEIPQQLASLMFLSFLNLSHNHLVGRIPQGSQMQTFAESFFIENEGLCGFPLNKSCGDIRLPSVPRRKQSTLNIEIFVSVALGFLVGICVIFVPLALSKSWMNWYIKHLDKIIKGSLA